MRPESSRKCSQVAVGVDNSKYCMKPGKPLLLFRAYKLTLKQEGMYSSVNSGREHSDGAADDTSETGCGVVGRRGK